MYASTSTSSFNSGSTNYLLDCFPAPPTQHVSFPMSDLRHSAPPCPPPCSPQPLLPATPRGPLLALPLPAQIDAGSTTFASEFSSSCGALGLHNISSQPSTPPLPYSPPAVISLGDEWTDDDTSTGVPSSSSSLDSSDRLDVFGDSGSYFALSPSASSSSSSLSPELATEQLPLWQAEHPRLVSIRDAVLSSERAARYREACLESEVARIKDDLARVKEARARARWVASRADPSFRRNSAPDASSHARTPTPLVRRASDSDVTTHQRRAAEQQHASSSSSSCWFTYDEDDLTIDEVPIPAESAGQFWDEHYPDPETMLANHLTEARSARAEERRKRKRDHERIRELGILLSLGSEVRQWEERLAWENAFRPTDATTDAMELDYVEDASSRRRSKSLPTTPPSGGMDSSSPSSPSSPLTPPLPPLSASPLWHVSAEMILRRRSLSERPRRITPVNANPPTHVSTEAPEDASTTNSSAKRQAVPPPISIPSSAPSLATSSLRSAPSRPSALKLCFTLEDLVAPEAAAVEKIEEDPREDEEMCNNSEESSEASDSDDSRCKSSSSNSSSSENEHENTSEKPLALRRGRSRWSWRKSLQSAQQLQQQLQQIPVDMEVDDA